MDINFRGRLDGSVAVYTQRPSNPPTSSTLCSALLAALYSLLAVCQLRSDLSDM